MINRIKPFLLYAAALQFVLPFLVSYRVIAREAPSRWSPELMITYKRVGGTAISPDGNLIAYTVSSPVMEGEKSEYLTHIWMVSGDGKTNYQYTRGEQSCSNPSFSPDGKYLAFISDRGNDKKNQVYLLRLTGGEAEQLTTAKSGVNSYAWSPDGIRIAYTMNDPETEAEEKDKKEKRDMRVLDTDFKYAHLYTTTVEKDAQGERNVKRLTSGHFHIIDFDWSPDGKTIAFSHQINTSVDEWATLDISSVPADSGAVILLVSGKGRDFSPCYSHDGKWLAYLSDGGKPKWAGHLFVFFIPAQRGTPKKLATTPDSNISQFIGWSSDDKEVYITEASRTSHYLYTMPVNGDTPRVYTSEPGYYSGISISKNGMAMAFVFQTPESTPDVHITGMNRFQPVKLTSVNAGYPKLPLGKTEVITWKSKDGMEIEGLLTYPVNYIREKRCPFILNIHGGPMGVFSLSYTAAGSVYPIQAFAQEGYAVLRPNPRGSSGYGESFRFANYNDWGYGDYEDVMAGVDKVIEMGVAHPDSLCVMGWSYGGFMTSFIITRTNRFKAASVGAGVTNLMSFTGTSDIPGFLPDYFDGEPWDRIEAYMKHSAMFNVKGVATPTQILHGEEDKRVPLSQGEELYNALKRQGCTTEMVIYPRMPHGISEPKFIEDVGKRILYWFNRQLGRIPEEK